MPSQSEPGAASAPIVVPDLGEVLGCRLGISLEEVIAVWPGGEVVHSATGRFTYSLTQHAGRCAALVSCRYRFVDERLTAVELRPAMGAPGGVERHLHARLAEELAADIVVEPILHDEGYVEYEVGQLRVAVDALDAVIRVEESL